MFLVSLFWTLHPSQDVGTDAGFLCNKAAMYNKVLKEIPCMSRYYLGEWHCME